MKAGRKNSFLTPKRAEKPAGKSENSDPCRLCGIYFKISVGNFGGKNKYISTENLFKMPQSAGVAKILLVDLLKIQLGVEVDQQGSTGWKIFLCLREVCGEDHFAMQEPCASLSGQLLTAKTPMRKAKENNV